MAKRNLPLGGAIPMEAGERDRRVLIQQATEGVATSGRPVETWTTLLPCVWMRRLQVSGRERYAANQVSAPLTAQWEMGYVASMDPELVDVVKTRRLLYQGRVYDITSADQIGRRDGIELENVGDRKGAELMVSIRFEGGVELADALAGLSARLSKQLLIEALTEGGEPIRKSAASRAARAPGAPDIADNIVISNAQSDDQAAVAIGPARAFYYGLFLEYGTVKMRAQPFERPALDENVDKSLGIISEALWRELAGRGISRPTVIAPADVFSDGPLL